MSKILKFIIALFLLVLNMYLGMLGAFDFINDASFINSLKIIFGIIGTLCGVSLLKDLINGGK